MTTTTNLGLTLPTPNVDTGWGSTLNNDFTLIDNLFAADGSGTSVGLNVGSGKTINVGGTLVAGGTVILGAGDGTTSTTAPTIRGAARTGTNVAGANLTVDAPNGTGTGGSGKFVVRTAPAGSTGSVANTLRSAFEVNAAGAIGVNDAAYGTANQVLVSGGSAAAATWGNVDGSVISIPSQAQGDIMYRGASSWTRLPAGTAGQVLTTQGAAANPIWTSAFTEGTAQTLTGLSAVTFSSLPSTVRRITIAISSLTMSSGNEFILRLGTSAGIVSTGYKAVAKTVDNDSGSGGNIIGKYSTTSFTHVNYGNLYDTYGTITLQRVSGNTWVASHSMACYLTGYYMSMNGAGTVTLSSVLDRLQLLPANFPSGATFASGTMNIQYE